MASWRKELKELTRRLPEVGAESAAMADAMGEKETDRGCALITGSIAENALEAILQTGTVSLSKTRRDELFGIDGVMGSFSAKIKVAFAFGLIDAELRDQFDRLREIRNAFAHAKVAINFNTPAVRHSCVGLLKSRDDKRIEPRNLYVNTTLLLMLAGSLAVRRERTSMFPAPISYDEALAFFEKWFRQFQQQIQQNLPEANKATTPEGPPQSSAG